MEKKQNNIDALRKKAEAKLREQEERLKDLSVLDLQHLVHELGTYQIELEMQNEELRKSQIELEDSRSKYSDLYDFAPSGYFTFDKNGFILEVNLTGAALLQKERSFLIKKPFPIFIHKDDQDLFYKHRHDVFVSGSRKTCEIRLKSDSSSQIFLRMISIPVQDSSGSYNQIRTAVSDITEQKQAEESLRISSERYRSYIELTGELGWTTNADGEVVEDLPSWRKYTGQAFEEIKGWGWSKALHPEDLEHTVQIWRKAVTEKSTYETEYRIRRHDGTYRHFLARGVPVFNKDGSIREWVGTCIDITERKQIEEALLRSNSFNQSIIDSSSDCIKILDIDGRLQFMSSGGQRLLKIKDIVTYLNVPYEEFWKGSDREAVIKVIQKAKEGQSGSFQGFCPTADGTPKWWDVCISPILDADGRPERLLAISRDITERNKAEEERGRLLKELERSNRELEIYSHTISHDLRAPLRSIEGFTQAILEDYTDKLDETGKDYLHRVTSASKRMSQLIDALLTIARLARAEIKEDTVDLSSIAQVSAYELKKRQPERQVEFIAAEKVKVKGDINLLRMVLENLLDNAWKFTGKHPSARIEFGVTHIDDKDVYFVRDDGAGFDMDFVDKLFGPFSRLHREEDFPGIGIGLAMVHKIIKKHGGMLWAESAPEEGATFYFTLASGGMIYERK